MGASLGGGPEPIDLTQGHIRSYRRSSLLGVRDAGPVSEGHLPVSLVSLLLFGRDVVFRKPECRLPSNAEMSTRVRLEVVFRGPECRPPFDAEILTRACGRLSSASQNVVLPLARRC